MAVERIREIRGRALPVRGDDIDTDRIIPARFLKSVSFEGLEQHLFEDDRREAAAAAGAVHPVSDAAYSAATDARHANSVADRPGTRPSGDRRRGIRASSASLPEIFSGIPSRRDAVPTASPEGCTL